MKGISGWAEAWTEPEGVHLDRVTVHSQGVTLELTTCRNEAPCPHCCQLSHQVHSHYRRTLSDLPFPRPSGSGCVALTALFLRERTVFDAHFHRALARVGSSLCPPHPGFASSAPADWSGIRRPSRGRVSSRATDEWESRYPVEKYASLGG